MVVDRSPFYTYNIMLGSACNWKCPYCIQSEEPIKQVDPNTFCDKFLEHLESTDRLSKIYVFNLWGGEPLLYYKSLEVLLKRLSEIPTQLPIRIVSNGSLLTEENYKLFNRYNSKFEISYHEGQLSDDKWRIALKIERIVVSSLITHKVTDLEFYHRKWQELYDKFGRYVSWCVFPIIYAGHTSNEYALNKEDIDKYMRSLYQHLDDLDNVFYSLVYNALIYGMSSRGMHIYGNKCVNDRTIDIDMEGNRYFCHHNYVKSSINGNIFTNNVIPINMENNEVCKKCEAYKICTGGCLRSKNKSLECYFYKSLWKFFQYVKSNYSSYFSQERLALI